MPKGKSTVEINGRIYDAKTGNLVSVSHSKTTVISSRRVIDGIVAPKNVHKLVAPNLKPHQPAKPATKLHTTAQKTKRLHPLATKNTKDETTPKLLLRSRRLTEASALIRSVTRSPLITRHLDVSRTSFGNFTKAVEAKVVSKADDMAPPMPKLPNRFGRIPSVSDIRPRPSHMSVAKHHTNRKQLSWTKRHLVPTAASFATLSIVGGFLIYNSLPSLTMRVAASRAGFHADVPNYQPSGFSFDGPVSYGPGKVIIRFNSKNDSTYYTVTEQSSAWDSKSLLQNYVKKTADNYLSFEEHGLTVYLYDKAKVTWVDNGVWYNIEGNANLSSEQLLKIAASL